MDVVQLASYLLGAADRDEVVLEACRSCAQVLEGREDAGECYARLALDMSASAAGGDPARAVALANSGGWCCVVAVWWLAWHVVAASSGGM